MRQGGKPVSGFSVVTEERRRQSHHVRAQFRGTAVRARTFAGQRPTRVVDHEFSHPDPLARQAAPQRKLIPVKVLNMQGEFLTMRQRCRRRGSLDVATGEIRYEQGEVPFRRCGAVAVIESSLAVRPVTPTGSADQDLRPTTTRWVAEEFGADRCLALPATASGDR